MQAKIMLPDDDLWCVAQQPSYIGGDKLAILQWYAYNRHERLDLSWW
jgi:hypothetical protein